MFRPRLAAAVLLVFLTFGTVSVAAELPVTPELVNQIQFMLTTVGINPGPIDGNPQSKTNTALHLFESSVGLPPSNLRIGATIPQESVDKLREAALAKFGVERKQPPEPPKVVTAPQPAAAPPPDRFASCKYDQKDFHIGDKQFTPQSFLDQGFNGSTNTAVENLKVRLNEARRIAEQNRGPALIEVQRQARVLSYFECRQKVENP